MTKTLTEQWREGKLPAGEYYVKDSTGVEIDGYYPENSWERGFINHSKYEVEEVLAPVPSYNEFLVLSGFKKIEKDAIDNLVKIHTEKLEKKLEISTKALEEISQHYSPEYNKGGEISHKALKEMEGVK